MKKRTIFFAFLVLILAVVFSACGKDRTQQGIKELRSSELAGAHFTPTKTSISGEAFRMVRAVSAGDSIICVGVLGEDASNRKYSVYRIDTVANTTVPIQGISLDSFETVDAIKDGSALVTYVDGDGGFHAIEIAPDNSTDEYIPELPEEMKGVYYSSVLIVDGGYLLNDGYSLTLIDRSGRELSGTRLSDRFSDIFRRPEGGFLAVCQQPERSETTFTELGQDLSVTAEYGIDESFSAVLQCNMGDEVLVSKEDVIYRMNYKTGEKQSYANIFASGNLGGSSFVYLNDESFFDGTKSFAPAVWYLQNGEEKQTITLGTYMPEQYDYISKQELKNAVNKFNDSNDKYSVELVDYAAYGDAGYDILLSDISTGNTTDIFDLHYLDSVLASKGILKDLYPLFEGEQDIDFTNMNSAVIDALDMDGKLFYFVPSYTVTTYVGRRSVIGDGEIDSEKFYALAEKYGTSDIFDTGITKEDFFVELLTSSAGEFIDYYNAKCSFDSPEFKRCLEYAQKLPDALTAETMESYGAGAYSGSALFMKCALIDDPVVNYLRYKSIFQGDMRACGFPASSGSGAFFTPTIMLGIAENSPNQEGAWEFLKYMLSDNYQWNCYDIPMNKGIMEQLIDGRVERFREPDRKIAVYMPAASGFPAEVYVDYLPADETVKNEVLDIICHVDSMNSYDTAVLDIILGEMGKLCSGSEGVDEAAANIQSRASIYMSEQYG